VTSLALIIVKLAWQSHRGGGTGEQAPAPSLGKLRIKPRS